MDQYQQHKVSSEKRLEKQNNQLFFILGISMLAIAVATDNPAFIGVGVVFMLMGFSDQQIEKNTGISDK